MVRSAVYTQVGLNKVVVAVPPLGHVRATPDSVHPGEPRGPGTRQGAAGSGRCQPRRLGRPVPPPVDVPERVDHVRGLQLVAVADDDQRRVWNDLMRREHPRGAVRHVGAQMRYLLVSEHGVLGALGFAAAALALAARDAFIGWEPARHVRQLHRVAGLGRFLIRPCVSCRNLAYKALSLALRRLPADFQRRYGYRPLLVETFVEKGRHVGTSLRAANWLEVGETAGRGRFAASGAKVAVKQIWLYPLARDWRAQLGVAEPAAPAALGPGAAQNEQAVRGYYRMIDQPAQSAVTPENILAPHRQRTL